MRTVGPTLTKATFDDWTFVVRCRDRAGQTFRRVIGVSYHLTYAAAWDAVQTQIRPPRATKEGRSPDIIDIEWSGRWSQFMANPRYQPEARTRYKVFDRDKLQ